LAGRTLDILQQLKWPSDLRLSRLSRHTLVQNALSLYGVFLPNYFIPLLVIPYLTRVLGAAAWGLVAFTQAFGVYIGVVVEFGFFLSANREVARCREDRNKLGEILASVLGARVLLCLACLGPALLAGILVPIFRDHRDLFLAGFFWGLVQGFSMSWFFQGLERMRLVAALETPSQFLGIIAIFLFVRRPQDAWLVLVIQGMAYAVPTLIELALAYREVPVVRPTLRSIREGLRMGTSMFLYRGSLELYARGNALILGLFVAPQLVGYYATAEKIARASYRALNPVTQALYPRMTYLLRHSPDKAHRLARLGLAFVVAGGMALTLLIYLFAPWIIRIIAGPEFAPAVPLLRILALMPALIAFGQAYGTQWMLPLGMDRSFNLVMVSAGAFDLVLALILAPRYAQFGVAWAVVATEAAIALGFYVVLRLQKLDPLRPAAENAGPANSL
jgi:PST family polysaccharide transporter